MDSKLFLKAIMVIGFTFIAIVILLMPRTTNKSERKVRIDSVTVKLRNPVLPDKMWVYHTKVGSFSTNQDKFNIGDSIPVTTIHIK